MMTSPETPPFVVRRGGRKSWLMVLGCLAFIAAGVWMISEYWSGEESLLTAVVGLVSIVFFGACLVLFLRGNTAGGPAVVLDDRGVTDRSSYTSGGFIEWESIAEMQLYELAGQKMIGIRLKDPASYLKQQRGAKRKLMQINEGMVNFQVSIPEAAIGIRIEQLYEEMLKRYEWAVRNGRA